MQRIAVIDDDEMNRSLLDAVLTEEGYTVILVEGPGDLRAQLTAAGPDLILLDLLLGTWGDGLALARAIRTDPLLQQVPVMVMSAAPHLLRQHSAVLADMRCRVLTKPFHLKDLLAYIKDALTSHQN